MRRDRVGLGPWNDGVVGRARPLRPPSPRENVQGPTSNAAASVLKSPARTPEPPWLSPYHPLDHLPPPVIGAPESLAIAVDAHSV